MSSLFALFGDYLFHPVPPAPVQSSPGAGTPSDPATTTDCRRAPQPAPGAAGRAKSAPRRLGPEAQAALTERLEEIQLLEGLVGALARDQYRWQPSVRRQSAAANLCRSITEFVEISDDTVRSRLRDIGQGGAQQARGSPGPAASAKVVTSLQKIALGIAQAKFGWRADASNRAAEARMLAAAKRQGVAMRPDALRRLLHEAERALLT